MNQKEKDIVRAALASYRAKHARSFRKPQSKQERSKEMEKVRSFITEESQTKKSLSLKGHFVSESTKDKIRQKALGRRHSEETKEKIRQGRTKQIVTESMLKALDENRGENSLLWKGDDVGYRALHRWIEKKLGKPDVCELCSKKGLEGHEIHWANKSQEYKRDVTDWIRLCALCHKKYDREK